MMIYKQGVRVETISAHLRFIMYITGDLHLWWWWWISLPYYYSATWRIVTVASGPRATWLHRRRVHFRIIIRRLDPSSASTMCSWLRSFCGVTNGRSDGEVHFLSEVTLLAYEFYIWFCFNSFKCTYYQWICFNHTPRIQFYMHSR